MRYSLLAVIWILTLIAYEWTDTVVLILMIVESSATQGEASQWESEMGAVQVTFVFHCVARYYRLAIRT